MEYVDWGQRGSVDLWVFSTSNSEAVLHHDIMLCFLCRFKVSETEMVLGFCSLCSVLVSSRD